jgi:site-specific recombinase XerD
MIKRIAGLAGIKRTIYPHKLGRRTGANLRSERGASNKTIQQLGRWKSLSMVDLYVHHTESTLERLQAETSPLDDILGDS